LSATPGSGLPAPELWCVDLDAAGAALHALEDRTPRLSDWDRHNAATIADASAAAQWRATHIALRLLLERAVGTRWRGAQFLRGAGVRPRLEGAPVAFSLSHAAGLALIGLTPGGDIGVDVERLRPIHIRASRRGLIETAGDALNARQPLPEDAEARFLQAWVRLEAFAKGDGCGVGRLLTRLGIVGGRDIARADLLKQLDAARAQAPANTVHDLDLGKGLFAAIALNSSQAVPEVCWLPTGLEGLSKLVSP
jgi:4'-phosphopantetheinyl transferase